MDYKKLSINLYCDNLEHRPRVSFEIRNYIEDFVINKILKEKKIIINSKWRIVLGISLLEREYNQDCIDILPPDTFSDVSVKQYTIIAPYLKRLANGNSNYEFANYLYEIVSQFLLENYKKVKEEELISLKKEIDLEYLRTIEYPASFENQKYIGDDDINVKNDYLKIHEL